MCVYFSLLLLNFTLTPSLECLITKPAVHTWHVFRCIIRNIFPSPTELSAILSAICTCFHIFPFKSSSYLAKCAKPALVGLFFLTLSNIDYIHAQKSCIFQFVAQTYQNQCVRLFLKQIHLSSVSDTLSPPYNSRQPAPDNIKKSH